MQESSDLIIGNEAADEMAKLIVNANTTLNILAYAISTASGLDTKLRTSVYRLLRDAPRRAIRCQMLIASHCDRSPHQANNTLAEYELAAAGWDIRRAPRSPVMHAKLMLADNRVMILGSHNLTRAGIEHNRELSILTLDPYLVSTATNYFNVLYDYGTDSTADLPQKRQANA